VDFNAATDSEAAPEDGSLENNSQVWLPNVVGIFTGGDRRKRRCSNPTTIAAALPTICKGKRIGNWGEAADI
jgi:hypothetical protein